MLAKLPVDAVNSINISDPDSVVEIDCSLLRSALTTCFVVDARATPPAELSPAERALCSGEPSSHVAVSCSHLHGVAPLCAAVLRRNRGIELIFTPSSVIRVGALRAASGRCARWSEVVQPRAGRTPLTAETPLDDFTTELVAGLLDEPATRATSRGAARTPTSAALELDLSALSRSSGSALAAAEHRLGRRLIVFSDSAHAAASQRWGRPMEPSALHPTPIAKARLHAARAAHGIVATPRVCDVGRAALRAWSANLGSFIHTLLGAHRGPLLPLLLLFVGAAMLRWHEHRFALDQGYAGGARLSTPFYLRQTDVSDGLHPAMIAHRDHVRRVATLQSSSLAL